MTGVSARSRSVLAGAAPDRPPSARSGGEGAPAAPGQRGDEPRRLRPRPSLTDPSLASDVRSG
jgi:hypothetical protein